MDETLLAQINQAHGTTFRLGQRYADGEQGAYALVDETGAPFVLKVTPDQSALGRLEATAVLCERLRARGYPAPRYAVVGTTATAVYSVQTALPGTPMRQPTSQHLPDVLALNAMQVGQAPDMPRTWPAPVVTPTLEGGPGFCLLEPMRAHSAESSTLLERLQAIVRRGAGLVLPQDDVVHFDFTPLNILVDGERITGVIDWDGACAGDRAFDLAALLFSSHQDRAVSEALYAAARELVGPEAVALYLAHIAHRLVDWMIRFHPPMVSYILDVAERQLGRYANA
jgi:Ser/Thr protein kinase RdoA (MazF antagonist)